MVSDVIKTQYQIKGITEKYCGSEEDSILIIEPPNAKAKHYRHTSTKHRVENQEEELHESRHHKNKHNQHHRYKSKKRTIRDREVEDARLDQHQRESEEYKQSKWRQEAKFQRKRSTEKLSKELRIDEPSRDEGMYDHDTRNDNEILGRGRYHLKSTSSTEKHRRSHERRSNQDRNEKTGNKVNVWEEPKPSEALERQQDNRQQTTILFKDPSPDLSINDSLVNEIQSDDQLQIFNQNKESSSNSNDLNKSRSSNRLNDDSYDYTNYINSSAMSDDETLLPEKSNENSTNCEEVDYDSLPPYLPAIQGCRNVDEYERLNRVAEGTYGVVYRAIDKRTKEVVAIKRLKMENETEGFPTTSLREINTLLKAQHLNIVKVREIVVGNNMNKIFIVMDYIEHDLKALMDMMELKNQVFLMGEIKCLMKQLLKAVAHLHRNWILHRDLKPSNLLLNNKGILKVGDFGLAREYGSPIKNYTTNVVTPWYRAPELLLGSKLYSTPIDVWSVGCIFVELLTMEPLFPGKSEIDLLHRIFKKLGTPNDKIWPGYSELPVVKSISFAYYPVNNLRQQFSSALTESGLDLLLELLTYNPDKRIEAKNAFKHNYFLESPLPIEPDMFPSWPAKSEFGMKASEQIDNEMFKQLDEKSGVDLRHASRQIGGGFCLKF